MGVPLSHCYLTGHMHFVAWCACKSRSNVEKTPGQCAWHDGCCKCIEPTDLALSLLASAATEACGHAGDEQLLLPAMTSVQSVAAGPPRDIGIVGFGKAVHVFSSKQQPKRLTIYAADFRQELNCHHQARGLLSAMQIAFCTAKACSADKLSWPIYIVTACLNAHSCALHPELLMEGERCWQGVRVDRQGRGGAAHRPTC